MGYLIIGDANTKVNKHAQGSRELNEKVCKDSERKFHFLLMVLPGARDLILFFYIRFWES